MKEGRYSDKDPRWCLTSQGFLPANPAQGLHLLSEPPAREALTACPAPHGVLGLCGSGDWEGGCEAGSPSVLRVRASGQFDFGEERERMMLL